MVPYIILYSTDYCVNPCAGLQHSTGTIANALGDECQCDSTFVWDRVQKICAPDSVSCSVDPSDSDCTILCENVQYSKDFTVGIETPTCSCMTGFTFDNPKKKCVIDCSLITNALVLADNTISQCTCKNKFEFDPSTNKCVIECCQVKNSDGAKDDTIDECKCKNDLVFDIQHSECIYDCSKMTGSTGTTVFSSR